jgi:hypothetical protein
MKSCAATSIRHLHLTTLPSKEMRCLRSHGPANIIEKFGRSRIQLNCRKVIPKMMRPVFSVGTTRKSSSTETRARK